MGPGPEDLEAIGSNLMALDRRHLVLETSLTTSARALRDPEVLEVLPAAIRAREQDVTGSGVAGTAAGDALGDVG